MKRILFIGSVVALFAFTPNVRAAEDSKLKEKVALIKEVNDAGPEEIRYSTYARFVAERVLFFAGPDVSDEKKKKIFEATVAKFQPVIDKWGEGLFQQIAVTLTLEEIKKWHAFETSPLGVKIRKAKIHKIGGEAMLRLKSFAEKMTRFVASLSCYKWGGRLGSDGAFVNPVRSGRKQPQHFSFGSMS